LVAPDSRNLTQVRYARQTRPFISNRRGGGARLGICHELHRALALSVFVVECSAQVFMVFSVQVFYSCFVTNRLEARERPGKAREKSYRS